MGWQKQDGYAEVELVAPLIEPVAITKSMKDMTRGDLLAYLNAKFGDTFYEYDKEVAIYWLSADYHDGNGTGLFEALHASPVSRRDKAHERMSKEANFLYCDMVLEFCH